MKPVIIAMTLALALSAYWITEELDCLLFSSGTDTCVECIDDCLDPDPSNLEAQNETW